MVIGAGPCGLRTALEAQLLGAKVVVVEKRDRYSRNNVLHLWPCNIQELRAMGKPELAMDRSYTHYPLLYRGQEILREVLCWFYRPRLHQATPVYPPQGQSTFLRLKSHFLPSGLSPPWRGGF